MSSIFLLFTIVLTSAPLQRKTLKRCLASFTNDGFFLTPSKFISWLFYKKRGHFSTDSNPPMLHYQKVLYIFVCKGQQFSCQVSDNKYSSSATRLSKVKEKTQNFYVRLKAFRPPTHISSERFVELLVPHFLNPHAHTHCLSCHTGWLWHDALARAAIFSAAAAMPWALLCLWLAQGPLLALTLTP